MARVAVPVPPHVRRLINEARAVCRRAGLKVPPLDVRLVRRLPKGRYGETWSEPDGTVRIDLTDAGCCAAAIAHEMAHAVLEPIITGSAQHHGPLWGVLDAMLYRALVE